MMVNKWKRSYSKEESLNGAFKRVDHGSTEQNTQACSSSGQRWTIFICHFEFFCEIGDLYFVNSQPLASPDSVPMSRLPGGWSGDLGITFLQLWRWVHRPYPTVKGGLVRLARLTTLSQWAVRNGRGNENRPQVCCPLPGLQGEPPESPFSMHIVLPLRRQSCV